MTSKHFIPIRWSDFVWQAWTGNGVLVNIVNRDYQGEIKQGGDTVKINGVVPPTIIDYKAAGRKITPEKIQSIQVELKIDQEKAYAFLVDDIDNVQANVDLMPPYTLASGRGLANDADKAVGAGLNAGATEIEDTGFDGDSGGFQARISELDKQLDLREAPKTNRFCVVSPTFKQGLLNPQGSGGSTFLTDASYSVDGALALKEAILGRLFGFTIVESNNIPDTYAIAFVKETYAFASQLVETEAGRAADSFADYVRGLHVYGHAPVGKLAGNTDNGIFKIKGTPSKGGGTGRQSAKVALSTNAPAPGETVEATTKVNNGK